MVRLGIFCAMTLSLACGGPGRHAQQGEPQPMPSKVLSKSDPSVDISGNSSTSHGGCGSWFNPCPDVNKRNGALPNSIGDAFDGPPVQNFGCFFCHTEGRPSPAKGALVCLLIPLLLWRRRRR